ncbi:NAD(P)H-dependent flavin oxidoreductase [Parasporobacterium paucivorans]|uniref:Probable nitronate monooxygenase n=1 Tax=Parasporobacterium paucivorans DSM 15970 TaxID=1122934 RepID=A0A1M6DKH9_9FIRM|nr:nitronate monooxygenase [Parasporobacterium paucivorans]SHI73712.1 NAD(P)H-dependent flavin oxidoreductase YrpB, nitropropane dioxygenase family [Parasporobacterium paucivorans DSM 15970]
MQKTLTIGNLTAKIPIIQGGMGVGISLSSLAGAVAREGAIGVISAAQIGFMESDFSTNPLGANLRALKKHIAKAKNIAPGGIIGVNIMVATKNYAQYVKASIEAGIDLIISGAGLPFELPSLVKGTGTKLIPIVSSLRAAQIILKMWMKKDGVLPDAIIIEGPLAGGHLGFKEEELTRGIETSEYEEEIRKIIGYVNEFAGTHNSSIPVITAGGISTKEEYQRQFELGASGVQISTKFVPTFECDAHENFKKAYLECEKEDIIIVKSPVGMPGRAIRNKFTELVSKEKIPIKKCRDCIITCNPATTRYCITDALINAARGNMDEALIFCGAKAYEETEIRHVKDVINDFIL